MADVQIDFAEWHPYVQFWNAEGPQVTRGLSADPTLNTQASSAFGKIGAPVRAALTDACNARAETGTALGRFCDGMGGHTAHDLTYYHDTEDASRRTLTT